MLAKAPTTTAPAAPEPVAGPPEPPAPESTDLFDYALLRDVLRYGVHSVRRHKLLVLGVMVVVLSLTFAAARLWPRTWHVESHLLAQRNSVIAALGNPGRQMPGELDAPTRAAREIIMRRDNLLTLIRQTDLVAHYWANRAPLLRFKDWLYGLVLPPMSEQDKMDAMVGVLEKQLRVETGDGTFSLYIDWPDPNMAYRLIEAAQQNFLETRHVEETSLITDAISILESHAEEVRTEMKQALDEVVRLQGRGRGGARPATGAGAPAQVSVASERPASGATEQQLNQLRFMLEAKQRSIADLEEFRSRRLSELQQQLAEQRVIYSDQHPIVLDIRQRITQLTQDSPQVAALRRDAEQLQAEYTRMGGKPGGARAGFARTEGSAPRSTGGGAAAGDDPELDFARAQLSMLSAKYQEFTLRVDAARIELDTARAAFKYRFTVIRPAQVPKKPLKPNVALIMAAGVFAALGLGVSFAVLRDYTSGKVLERWQVERQLALPVLAEVTRR